MPGTVALSELRALAIGAALASWWPIVGKLLPNNDADPRRRLPFQRAADLKIYWPRRAVALPVPIPPRGLITCALGPESLLLAHA